MLMRLAAGVGGGDHLVELALRATGSAMAASSLR
jgi:hypothetical protein